MDRTTHDCVGLDFNKPVYRNRPPYDDRVSTDVDILVWFWACCEQPGDTIQQLLCEKFIVAHTQVSTIIWFK